MRQIPLPLNDDSREVDLIITASNQSVFDRLSNLQSDMHNRIILVGDAHSGKHLFGQYFAQQHDAIFIENADDIADDDLFYAWNKAHDAAKPIVFCASSLPSSWQIALPDLRSRIASMELIELAPPDDELIVELIIQKMRLSNAAISPNALSYCLKRIERDYGAVNDFIEKCITLASENNAPIKLDDVKQILHENQETLGF